MLPLSYMDAGAGLAAKLSLNASQPIMRGVKWAEWPIYVYLPEIRLLRD